MANDSIPIELYAAKINEVNVGEEADKEDSFEDGQDRGGEVVSQNPVARKSKYS